VQTSGFYKNSGTTKAWAFRNNFFIRSDMVLHPEMVLDKFYKGETFIEVPKFRINAFWQIIWFLLEEEMCFEMGFNSDPISILIRTGFNIIECYKVII
jgi:hypothetical protein